MPHGRPHQGMPLKVPFTLLFERLDPSTSQAVIPTSIQEGPSIPRVPGSAFRLLPSQYWPVSHLLGHLFESISSAFPTRA